MKKDKNRENNNATSKLISSHRGRLTELVLDSRRQTADCYEIVSITSVIPFHYHLNCCI